MRNFLAISGLMISMASCSLHEQVQLNANNSVARNMEFRLDSGAATKMVAIAQQQGQNTGFTDSVSYAWDSLSANIKRNALQVPGASADVSQWNKTTRSGNMKFKLPSLDSYNQFASNTVTLPNDMGDKMPLGGLKRENISWKGKDTLVITLDNSHPGADEHAQETQQSLALVKILIGLDALMQYKADFILPKPAKAVIGEGASLSADKKTVLYSKSLDQANETGNPDVIKVVF